MTSRDTSTFLHPGAKGLSPGAVAGLTTLLGFGLLLAPGLCRADDGAVQIGFASGQDGTGTVQRLVDAFNREHRGKIEVTWRPMPEDNDAHHRHLTEALAAKADGYDVVASDVVWTAELAQKGWVVDATRRFYEMHETAALLEPALESATYRLRIWGVPWYADVSLLFYRKDLLAKSGFETPPQTWDELIRMAEKVQADSGTKYGYVFQGASYEGGATNALELIWSAGGRALTRKLTVTGAFGRVVTEVAATEIDTPEAARGLDLARRLVKEGVAPAAVADFRERQSFDAFAAGDAVFLRSWPYVYGALAGTELRSEDVGVAPLPAASGDHLGYSCLGGWNLMVNASANARERKAAFTFVRYLTSRPAQKQLAVEAGLLPVLVELYDDPTLADRVPALAVGQDVLTHRLRSRPTSPFYADISAPISAAFGRVLRGELSGAEAVKALETQLRAVAIRNR